MMSVSKTEKRRRIKTRLSIKKKSEFEKIFKDSAFVLRRGNIFKLNQTGALIWKFIDKIPIHKIVQLISKEKKIPIDKAQDMIYGFVDELRKNDLIELG